MLEKHITYLDEPITNKDKNDNFLAVGKAVYG